MSEVDLLYELTSLRAEEYRKENMIREEIAANRKLISQLERNVRENSWDPPLSLLQLKTLVKDNADLVDSEQGANNYAEFNLHPDYKHKNKSAKWKSGLSIKDDIFQELLKNAKKHDPCDPVLMQLLRAKQDNPSGLETNPSGLETNPSGLEMNPSGLETTSLNSIDSILPSSVNTLTKKSTLSDLENSISLPMNVGGSGAKSSFESSPDFDLFLDDDNSSGSVESKPPMDLAPRKPAVCASRFPPASTASANFREKVFGAGSVLNAVGGYNRPPRPVYPASQRKPQTATQSVAPPPFKGSAPIKPGPVSAFKTAHQQLIIDKQNKKRGNQGEITQANYGAARKCLGTRPGPAGGFKPPVKQTEETPLLSGMGENPSDPVNPELLDERYKNIDPKMIELIQNEIMDNGSPVHWDDIAGLEFQKTTVREIVVLPMLRPDIFTGLRGPPKGLLLFGPPGTGKTLIGKCIASQSKSTFFSISASSLTSKWVGEGEKMVRALFAVAKVHQPSVIFIDEIDSLLSARSESEHESSRRMKTEFLVQLDGVGTDGQEKILIVGATNRPQELDEAARRRLVKRLLIPLPEKVARQQIIQRMLGKEKNELSSEDIDEICERTEGYSGADMANLCREAAMGPIRSLDFSMIESMHADQVRPIIKNDLMAALRQVKASVSDQDLQLYEDWNEKYGAGK